jgi:DNA-binding Xre family transcriptional regulator
MRISITLCGLIGYRVSFANIYTTNINLIVLRVQVIEVKLKSAMAKYSEISGQRLTYQDLAELTGISKATIEAIGSRPDYNTTLSTIDVLCKTLECSIHELIEFHKE